MSALRTSFLAAALLAVAGPASAKKGGPATLPPGDWVVTYDYNIADVSDLDSLSPYWEAVVYSNGDLELTLLAFPMFGGYLPTSVWGTWDTRRGGKTLVMDPDPYTHLEGTLQSDGCYEGTLEVTSHASTLHGLFEACPVP